MFKMHSARHREFNYRPKYYKPPEDDDNGKRIQFRRIRKTEQAGKGSIVKFLALILMLLYFAFFFKGGILEMENNDPIVIEEIIIE